MLTNQFGIYVHIPFCRHRCSYCDFYSSTDYSKVKFLSLVESLILEASNASLWLRENSRTHHLTQSIFLGGGTPSLLPINLLSKLLNSILDLFPLASPCEVTIEANPETVTDELLSGLLDATPVNRISLGAQSFKHKFLEVLDRRCEPEAITRAVRYLKARGISNFNLDLIFGIPGQTIKDMLSDIDKAASCEPTHISFYTLTLKPGHMLYDRLPDGDLAAEFYEQGCSRLQSLGYKQYEISSFCLPGYESSHNLLYWNGGDFLGLGPSAASRFFWDGTFFHSKQLADYNKYISVGCKQVPSFEKTTRTQTIIEATFLELRKSVGVNLLEFFYRYGIRLTESKKFEIFRSEGLLEVAGDTLMLSKRGRLLADCIAVDLLDSDLMRKCV